MPHPNIRDVAAMAGVAVSTVSVVLNAVDGARVSDATRRRVQEAAELLGYTPNTHARNLRSASTGLIAVVTDRITTSAYGVGILHGAQEAAWRNDLTLVTLTTGSDPSREAEAIRYAAGIRCRGIIVASAQHYHRPPPKGQGVIMVNCEPLDCADDATGPDQPGQDEQTYPPHAVPDEAGCGAEAVAELAGLGHTEFGVMVVDSPSGLRRGEGARAALTEFGLADEESRIDVSSPYDATADGGYQAAKRLLEAHPQVTALTCLSDRMAMGAYRAAAELGRRVPEDISIVGSDDIEPIAESLHPSLTTWASPDFEMGEWAVQVCLDPAHPAWKDRRHNEFRRPLVRRFSAARRTRKAGDRGDVMAT